MSEASTSQPTYSVGERVLCYHGPLIYEAKVMKIQNLDESNTTTGQVGPHYFVHYKGWKQTWDELVPASRLLKHTHENIQIQKAVHAASAAQNASSASKATKGRDKDMGGSSTRGMGRKDGTRGTKRGRDDDESSRKPDMKLNVPELLKVQLVDDWEAVTKNNQLVDLPRNPTVAQILGEFEDYLKKEKPASVPDALLLVHTVVSGLQIYFDRSCGSNLLYRLERQQYAEVRKKHITGQHVNIAETVEMSAVYGAEHLLRMLVALPQMIATSQMDADSVNVIRSHAEELLRWMEKERERLFMKEYVTASPSYQNMMRS